MTTLVACSHGTRFDEGRAVVRDLVDAIRAQLPGVRVEQAFVDVEEPTVADVVASVAEDGPAVVVPLLLSTGFHTDVDVADAVAPYPHVVRTRALGPHDLLALVLESRLDEAPAVDAGRRPGDHVVLAAAGSTNPAAVADVEGVADRLRRLLPCPVTVAYAAGAEPRIPAAVAQARADGAHRVIAASYVLAPGYFANLVAGAGADVVSRPLGADPRVAAVAVARYRDALAQPPAS
ncbi:sirohydrochlorin chelatase [Microbacterium gilvum]|uniref:Cobalamin biosynthesis protein CbiX n=1 Tax=Microbacterium gilvum TaxID=1336204 RepID=A0ABP8ZSA0_9MICO